MSMFFRVWHGTCLNYFASEREATTACCKAGRSKSIWGHPRVFQLNDEGNHMPAFTFEKISPPKPRGPVPNTEEKQRGVITQILDRFVGIRMKRTADKVTSTARRDEPRRR
uniref:Uncharacterized protein n=1 Tax=Rhodopseudomonas palustris (strain BisA53) TaxID=316055 RepID=Q07PR6_RHOP5